MRNIINTYRECDYIYDYKGYSIGNFNGLKEILIKRNKKYIHITINV